MHDVIFALGWWGFGAVSTLVALLLRGAAVQSGQRHRSKVEEDVLGIIEARLRQAREDAGR